MEKSSLLGKKTLVQVHTSTAPPAASIRRNPAAMRKEKPGRRLVEASTVLKKALPAVAR